MDCNVSDYPKGAGGIRIFSSILCRFLEWS